MKKIDFSRNALSGKYYGGSERKLGIKIGKDDYMLKFQKKTPFGLRNNHISEYIGSHIFALLGYEVQETYLGTYKGEMVVACKDFNVYGRQFVPFNEVGESTLEQDKETYQYSYNDIMQMLRDNSKLTDVEETISMFWEMFIVDAFIGNFDRHGSNWGFVKEDNKYSIAPVFDNGSCLFPGLVDEDEMLKIISSETETNKRIYTFPASQIKLGKKKSSYYEIIHSLEFPECNAALKKVFERLDMKEVIALIEKTPMISTLQKQFYVHILRGRYEVILKDSYRLLMKKNKLE